MQVETLKMQGNRLDSPNPNDSEMLAGHFFNQQQNKEDEVLNLDRKKTPILRNRGI